MTEARKRQCEIYIRDWLNTVRSTDESGNKLLNLESPPNINLKSGVISKNDLYPEA